MKKSICLLISVTAMILGSCQAKQGSPLPTSAMTQTLRQASTSIEIIPTTSAPPTPAVTETFVSYGCQEPGYPAIIQYANNDGFGDKYIARIPVTSAEGKDYEEIVNILVTQWLEHYKTASASPSAAIDNYAVKDIILIDPSCDPFFRIVASVRFSVIPAQVPHDMASFPGDPIQEEGVWRNVSMPVGVFIDGDDYRLRLVFGWGT